MDDCFVIVSYSRKCIALHCIGDSGGKRKSDNDIHGTAHIHISLSNHIKIVTRSEELINYYWNQFVCFSLSFAWYIKYYHRYLCLRPVFYRQFWIKHQIDQKTYLCSDIYLNTFVDCGIVYVFLLLALCIFMDVCVCVFRAGIAYETNTANSRRDCIGCRSITKSEIEQKQSIDWKFYDEIS